VRVGGWTVEPSLNQLRAAGKTVKLEPKSMGVLVCLIDRPGQVVSREALLSAIWPGVVVGDDSLTQVITKLRKALREVPDASASIQTISKRGYRLVARVIRADEVTSAPVEATAIPRVIKPGLAWRASVGVGVGVAALLVGAGMAWVEGTSGLRSVRLTTAGTDAARIGPPTVAITPFDSLGKDAIASSLAQGITADLVTDLSKMSGLWVTGTAPSRYLVSGSVQRSPELLRLQIHLTDGESGRQLWSERFDSALADPLAIQRELGPKILRALPEKIDAAEVRRAALRDTANMAAYEYFRRGQAALSIGQKPDNETARGMFRRAIALDPAFARAYASLALTYAADHRNQWAGDAGPAALDRAFQLASTAHSVNPHIRETYWALALVHRDRHQPEQALRYLETAVRLFPSYADAYALMGSIKTYVGRPAEALPLLLTAMRLNPQGGNLYLKSLGRAYFALDDLEQARASFEQALSRNASDLDARVYMAALHVRAGEKSDAAWQAQEIRALQPGFSGHGWLRTSPMADIGQKKKLLHALAALGLV
jgi:DNA-binding winged helix-turn-helix (wHTH) protein/TolB-like protein/Tfp pilus assembly protein PilF